MNCGIRVHIDPYPAELLADLARLDELWNDGFSRFGGLFLAGKDFSAVDAFFAPVAFRIQTFAIELSERSLQYVEMLLALPSMQEWYDSALDEIWRDESHEEEILQSGTLLTDFRQPAS